MFVKEDTRELARIVQIEKLLPIPKADRLEIAVVGGWECVVVKGAHQVGEPIAYFEIDAAIPIDHPLWHDFDKKYLRIRVEKGTLKEYATIKTVRLRGALSQGLALPMSYLVGTEAEGASIGQNITNALGILKYVSPEEAKLYAAANGEEVSEGRGISGLLQRFRNWLTKGIIQTGQLPFPKGHVKSDEERVQNSKGFYDQMVESGGDAEATIKLDGESTTFYTDVDTAAIGVASRNHALRTEDVAWTAGEARRVYVAEWIRFLWRRLNGATAYRPKYQKGYMAQSMPSVAYFHRNNIGDRIRNLNMNSSQLPFVDGRLITIQGEMVGPGYNKNKEGLNEVRFYVYRAYLNGNLLCNPAQSRQIAYHLGLDYIPVVDTHLKLPADIKALIKMADGPGYFDPKRKREGIVIKDNVTGKGFKVISNAWLEKEAKEEEEAVAAEAQAQAEQPAEATA
jgi:hypothetical protein